MRVRLLQLVVLLVVVGWTQVHAAPGDVDTSFVYPRPGIPEPDSTNAIPLADGFLIIKSRNFDQAGSNSTLEVTRIDEDGRVVPAFGSDGRVVITMPGPVNVSSAVKGLQNGSMLLAGFRLLPAWDSDSSAAIVRLDATGRLDPTFGTAGVATLDVPGQRDRVGAIDVLADGRILAGVWSSVAPDPYGDCSADRVSLVRLNPDGTAPEVIYYREKNAFADSGCRNTMTLQVMPDQRFYFGSSVEIVEFASPEANGWHAVRQVGCCSGPFAVDSRLGVVWASPFGASLQTSRFPYIFDDANGNNNLALPVVLRGMGFPSQLTTSQLVPQGDPPAWYLGFSSDGGFVGVAKLRSDGSLDSGWARGTGVVRIDVTGRRDVFAEEGLASDLRLINVRPGGNTVVLVTADGIVERRFARSDSAHGQIVLVDGWTSVPEAAGVAKVRVARVGGADGAISVDYHFGVEVTSCQVDSCATPGIDFVGVNGRLDWADGDSSDRYITIPISNDDQHEPDEVFGFELGTPAGGAIVVGTRLAALTIVDDDPASAGRAGGGASHSGGSGGGGSINWLLLALLSSGALARRSVRAAVARRSRRLLLASTLAAVAAPAAWGGIGDMDPSYGDGGVLRLDVIGLPLQDGRLLYRTSGGFGRTDLDGHADMSFGVGGTRAWPEGIGPGAWARAQDGKLLTAGTVQGSSGVGHALVRLRADGDIDATFGDGGLVALPSQVLPSLNSGWIQHQVAVQLDGRILVLTEVLSGPYDVIEAMELVRLLPDGTPDRTFGLGGVVAIEPGGAEYLVMDALRDGRIRFRGDRLFYLTAAGANDPGLPAVDSELGTTARHWVLGAPTADGGRILFAPEREPDDGSGYVIARLRSDGTLDRSFGLQGSGILTLTRPSASSWTIGAGFVCSADGRYLYAGLAAGSYRAGLARFRAMGPDAGSLDPAFGNRGIVEFGRMFGAGPVAGTADGGVVVGSYPPAYFRLQGIDRPSPGFANLASDQQMNWREDQGPIKVRVSRLAGSSGPLRIRYATATYEPSPNDPIRAAQPGVDYESVSGELVWADGDNTDKMFSIPLLTDGNVEPTEVLKVELSSSTPGSWVGSDAAYLTIADRTAEQPPPAPPPTPTPPVSHSSGGGAVGGTLLALLALARAVSRRSAT